MKLRSSSETGTCSFMPNLSGHLFVHSVYFCQMGGQTVTEGGQHLTQTSNLLDTSQLPQLPTLAQQVRTCLSVGTASYRGSGCCGDKVGS